MFIETYQVEEHDSERLIHYNGFTHACFDDNAPYGATEGTFCYVPIGTRNYERACDEFENVKQYDTEFSNADELLDYESNWKRYGEHLHMNEVTQATPCGMYWFELDE